MAETPGSTTVSTKLQQIATLARRAPEMAFTTLAHHIDLDWLREAYRLTRKDGARGVDDQSADKYAKHLDENLASLLERAKAGTYRAPPVRRVHIPKGNGTTQTLLRQYGWYSRLTTRDADGRFSLDKAKLDREAACDGTFILEVSDEAARASFLRSCSSSSPAHGP